MKPPSTNHANLKIARLRKPVVMIMWCVTQAPARRRRRREERKKEKNKKARSAAEKAFNRAPLSATRNLVNDRGAQRAFQLPPLLLRERM